MTKSLKPLFRPPCATGVDFQSASAVFARRAVAKPMAQARGPPRWPDPRTATFRGHHGMTWEVSGRAGRSVGSSYTGLVLVAMSTFLTSPRRRPIEYERSYGFSDWPESCGESDTEPHVACTFPCTVLTRSDLVSLNTELSNGDVLAGLGGDLLREDLVEEVGEGPVLRLGVLEHGIEALATLEQPDALQLLLLAFDLGRAHRRTSAPVRPGSEVPPGPRS
jgi:hypothetical protein